MRLGRPAGVWMKSRCKEVAGGCLVGAFSKWKQTSSAASVRKLLCSE